LLCFGQFCAVYRPKPWQRTTFDIFFSL